MPVEDENDYEPPQARRGAREYVRVAPIFVVAAASAMCGELLLYKVEPVFSFVVAFIVWIIASSRFYLKTSVKRALYNGAIVGVAIAAFLYIFRFIR